jgi:hypothetical protein
MTDEARPAAHRRERIVPIKILGHWEDARVHVKGGDLFIDIPARLIALVEADHPGVGVRFGYQLLIERYRIIDLGVGPAAGRRPGYDEHGVLLGEENRDQLEVEDAAADRQRRLEKAARAIERGELDLPTPEELAAMRRGRVGGWHERLHATFNAELDLDGRWWIWHHGLSIYGDGESYEEAKADLLEEIAEALDEWKKLIDA